MQRQLTVEKRSGGRLIAPKKQFVLSSSWDTNLHGVWDPSKEVEAEIGGVKKKGVWRLVGREGVYDFEEYEDTALSEQVLEHGFDHEAAFSEQAFGRKKDALQARDQLGRSFEPGSTDRWHLWQQLFQGRAFGQVS